MNRIYLWCMSWGSANLLLPYLLHAYICVLCVHAGYNCVIVVQHATYKYVFGAHRQGSYDDRVYRHET